VVGQWWASGGPVAGSGGQWRAVAGSGGQWRAVAGSGRPVVASGGP